MKPHRLTTILFVFCLFLILCTGAISVQAADNSALAINYTPKMTDNIFRYLEEVYIQKYPQLGLRLTHGTLEDQQNIIKLADIITEGCTSDREKASAILGWVQRNITYSFEGPFYSTDVFYARMGPCAAYGQMMQDLLRASGIPAVYGNGVRGEGNETMETMTVQDVLDKDARMEGHAWCYAYIDGQWLLYDPLWSNEGISDKAYISKWYFQNAVDCITPVYGNELPPMRDPEGFGVLYRNGRFMQLKPDFIPTYAGNMSWSINWAGHYCFSFCTCEPDSYLTCGRDYLYDPQIHENMIPGEAHHGGWISYSGLILTYAYENGVQADGVIMELEGSSYYMSQGGGWLMCADPKDYWIQMGYLAVEPGFTGRLALPVWYAEYEHNENYTITWTSSNPDQIAVDQNGVITVLSEGSAYISPSLTENGIIKSEGAGFTVWSMPDTRVADFSDNTDAPPASIPTDPTYGDEECQTHSFTDWEIIEEPSKESEGLKFRYCTLCGMGEEDIVRPFAPPHTPDDPPQIPIDPDVTVPSAGIVTDELEDSVLEELFSNVQPGEVILLPTSEHSNGIQMNAGAALSAADMQVFLEATFGDITVRMDPETLYALSYQLSGDDITLSVLPLDTDKLTQPQQDRLEELCVVQVFQAFVSSGGVSIRDFMDGIVTVSIPFTPEEGYTAGDYQVYYVGEDGDMEQMQTFMEDGSLFFVTNHFSRFVLVNTAAPSNMAPGDPGQTPSQQPDLMPWLLLAAGVLIFAAGAATAVILTKKRR